MARSDARKMRVRAIRSSASLSGTWMKRTSMRRVAFLADSTSCVYLSAWSAVLGKLVARGA